MKIALILTGHPRQYLNCYPAVKHFILDRHDVDVYISTWDHNFNHIERKHLTKPMDPGPVIDLYKPIKAHIENHTQYYENKKNIQFDVHPASCSRKHYLCKVNDDKGYCHALENVRDQWYIVKKGFELIENPQDYDYIMKLRLDVMFGNLVFQENVPTGTVIVPFDNEPGSGVPEHVCNDTLAYGDPATMAKYCQTYDYFEEIIKNRNGVVWMEWILGYYLKYMCGITAKVDRQTLNHSLCHHLPDV
jgi:hypothetical protein